MLLPPGIVFGKVGAIEVESEPGKGSIFRFTVRCEAGAAPDFAQSAPDEASAPSLSPLRVLVAEDNRVNQMVIAALLAQRGHSFEIVGNGRLAVEAVSEAPYDLVLMDVQMPEMDGPTAARAIRALGGPVAKIPIVALTANAMIGQREEFLAAGMDDYVAKPIQPVKLHAAMARALRRADDDAGARAGDIGAGEIRLPA